jgi:hypothetical protein
MKNLKKGPALPLPVALWILAMVVWLNTPCPGTALGSLAASMTPNSWAELTNTSGFNGGTIFTRCVHSSLAYCNEAVWDSVDKRVYFIGSGHGDWSSSNCIAFIQYNDATDTWSTLPKPPFYSEMHHGYDHTAICVDRREIYHKTSGGENLYKYDMNTGQWSLQTGTYNSSVDCRYGALEYFPDLGSLLFYREPYLWNLATERWTEVSNNFQNKTPSGDWTYHCFAEYNPVHKVMIMGGGNGSVNLYKLGTDGQMVQMNQAPFGLGVNGSIEYADTRTGKFIVYAEDGSNRMFTYDVTSDTWTQLSGTAPFRTGYGNWKNLVGCFISTYGVGFYVQWDGSSSKIYLYKPPAGSTIHTGVPGITQPPGITVHPNPFFSSTVINTGTDKNVQCRIYNAGGRLVHEFTTVRGRAVWNAGRTAGGVYILKVKIEDKEYKKLLLLMK